jgi:hypothetical protein
MRGIIMAFYIGSTKRGQRVAVTTINKLTCKNKMKHIMCALAGPADRVNSFKNKHRRNQWKTDLRRSAPTEDWQGFSRWPYNG